MRTLVFASATIVLAACSATGTTNSVNSDSYAARYAQLGEDCRARGGILIPSGGEPTGNPATEYACDIRSGGVLID